MNDELNEIPDFENILSASDKINLRRQLDNIPKLRRNVQKARRAGLDVSGMDEKIDEMEKKISALLNEL